MSELSGVLAVGANYETEAFSLSGNTQSLLFYALQAISNKKAWISGPLDTLTDSEYEQILDLIDNATREVMETVILTPVGTLAMWLAATPPTKWLIADGSAISRTDYAELFAVISTTYGAGDGTTTFNLPDMRDRSPLIKGTSFPNLNQKSGAFTHQLTAVEMPSHAHGVVDNGHTHPPLSPSTVFRGALGGGTSGYATVNAGQQVTQPATTGSAQTGISIANAGGNASHNNLHPIIVVNAIIYAGV